MFIIPLNHHQAFFGTLGPIQRIAPYSPSEARERASTQKWLKGHVYEVRRLVHPASARPQSSIELAVELPEGWIYVDWEGVVSGAMTGSFDVLGWRNLLKRLGGPVDTVDTDTITIDNRTNSHLYLKVGEATKPYDAKPHASTSILAWYGTYDVLLHGQTVARVSRLREVAVLRGLNGIAITSRYQSLLYGVRGNKVVLVRQGHLRVIVDPSRK